MYNISLNKFTPRGEDGYIDFMVYLRSNGVWKAVNKLFRMLHETRPADPIEYFRANVKPENSDTAAVEQMSRKIATVEEKLTTLRRDRVALTAKLHDSLRRATNGCESPTSADEGLTETPFPDHVCAE